MVKNTLFGFLVMVFVIGLSSCGDDVQDPLLTTPMSGKIGAVDWEFTIGKALYNNFERSYYIEVYNFDVNADGCALFGGNSAYASFEIPDRTETITQPSINFQTLTFNLPNSTTAYTATQGYIEIILINSFEVRGIINARFDDENFLEGVFSVELCN